MPDKQLAPDTMSGAYPTARDPWTVTLCWTPDQNSGRVSVHPNRHPVTAVWGLLTAGETPETVSEEHACTPVEVRVLDVLRQDAADVDPGCRMDGDLIWEVVANSCPDVLSIEAARAIADRVVASLADVPGVTVLRGGDSRPWRPADGTAVASLALVVDPERRFGRVTVGRTRLPASMVLGVLRAHGIEEARLQWPQFGDEGDLHVLARLVDDLHVEADGDAVETIRDLRHALGEMLAVRDDPKGGDYQTAHRQAREALDATAAWEEQ
jgi:uncharacterized protein (DUF433 family)